MLANRVESEVGQVCRTLLTVICGGAVASGANGAVAETLGLCSLSTRSPWLSAFNISQAKIYRVHSYITFRKQKSNTQCSTSKAVSVNPHPRSKIHCTVGKFKSLNHSILHDNNLWKFEISRLALDTLKVIFIVLIALSRSSAVMISCPGKTNFHDLAGNVSLSFRVVIVFGPGTKCTPFSPENPLKNNSLRSSVGIIIVWS